MSVIPGETSRDYSEFTADITPQSFADISVVGGHLYRNDGRANPHSCTPGVFEGTQGMCVSARRTCDYQPLTNKSVNFDISVVPLGDDPVRLTELNFYELAPEMYTFINGNTGINGFPTLYGVRVLRDGREIFRSTENPTTQGWTLESFAFEETEDFIISEPTTFTFMLLGYCAVSNLPEFKVWDLDNISVVFEGPEPPNGGVVTGGPFEFCQDDQPDFISGLTLTGNVGPNSIWLITDHLGVIVAVTNDPTTVDFNGFDIGECFVSHLSFTDDLTGLMIGGNISELQGCFGFSNFISIRRSAVEAGELSGGPYVFCVDDEPDFVQDVVLTGQSGGTGVWLVTDENRNIIALPTSPEVFDFDAVGAGICSLSVSYTHLTLPTKA